MKYCRHLSRIRKSYLCIEKVYIY